MRPRPVPALLAVLAGAALAPPLAVAAAPQFEQFNRATGVDGAFGLVADRGATRIGGVTDNGRYVFWSSSRPEFSADAWLADAEPGEGLWVRDVLRNRTTRISSDPGAAVTGIDRTQHLVSIVTAERLASADTNDQPDLYAYEPLTGLKVLVSRVGRGGAAVGITSFGTITRGSTVAVYGTKAGVVRRDLLTGRTTRVGAGAFIEPLENGILPYGLQTTADQYVSNDGKVVLTDSGVITPRGIKPLPTDEYGEQTFKPFVTEAGDKLIWQAANTSIDQVRTMALPSGVVTAPPVPEALASNFGVPHRPTPDGSSLLLSYLQFDGGPDGYTQTTKKWNLTTGAVTDLTDLLWMSRNEGFGLNGDRSGAYLVGAAPGRELPGGVDLPSPVAYLNYSDGCEWDDEGVARRLLTVAPERNVRLPLATTVRFQASAGAGQPVVVDRTVDVPTDNGYHEESVVRLPFADGAFRLDITLTLADGRTLTSRVDHVAREASESCRAG